MTLERTVRATDGRELGYVGLMYENAHVYSALCSVPGCLFESGPVPGAVTSDSAFRRALKVLERHLDREHGPIQFDRTFPSLQEQRMRRRLRRLSRRGAARQLWRALLHR